MSISFPSPWLTEEFNFYLSKNLAEKGNNILLTDDSILKVWVLGLEGLHDFGRTSLLVLSMVTASDLRKCGVSILMLVVTSSRD